MQSSEWRMHQNEAKKNTRKTKQYIWFILLVMSGKKRNKVNNNEFLGLTLIIAYPLAQNNLKKKEWTFQ